VAVVVAEMAEAALVLAQYVFKLQAVFPTPVEVAVVLETSLLLKSEPQAVLA
jgi:hypothetical protein